MPIRFIAALLVATFAVSCVTSAEYSSIEGPDKTRADARSARVISAASREERSSESPSDVIPAKASSAGHNAVAEKSVRSRAAFDPSATQGGKHSFLTKKYAGFPTWALIFGSLASVAALAQLVRFHR